MGKIGPFVGLDNEIGPFVGIGPVVGIGLFGGTGPVVSLTYLIQLHILLRIKPHSIEVVFTIISILAAVTYIFNMAALHYCDLYRASFCYNRFRGGCG